MDKVLEGVVVNPELDDNIPSRSLQKNVIPGVFMDIKDYDSFKEKGHTLGVASGKLAWTQEGRREGESTLARIRNQIKQTTTKTFFGGGGVNDEQILYEVESGTRIEQNSGLDKGRIVLKRARNLVDGQSPIVSEDNFRGNNFQKAVLEKAIADGWQEMLEKSQFKNEAKVPWYLARSNPRTLSLPPLPARKVKWE